MRSLPEESLSLFAIHYIALCGGLQAAEISGGGWATPIILVLLRYASMIHPPPNAHCHQGREPEQVADGEAETHGLFLAIASDEQA